MNQAIIDSMMQDGWSIQNLTKAQRTPEVCRAATKQKRTRL